MQVDLVITELNVGGAERALTRLAIGLHNRGDEVRVFSLGSLPLCGRGDSGRDGLVRELREHDIEIENGHGKAGRMGRGLIELPLTYRKLRRWLNRRPGAICQSFLFHANVLSSHALGKHHRHRQPRPWVAGVRVADPNSLRIAIEGHSLRRAEHVVCVSAATQRFAKNGYRLAEHQSSVIGNAVESQRFSMAKPLDWQSLGWPADSKIVLFIGRLHEQKNLELLQQSLDGFTTASGDRKLVIVGDGPLRGRLQQWSQRCTGDRVRILPWQADVAPLIAACSALVLPSHYEGMPNVVLEAMAGGKPVVCSRVEGSRELIGTDPHQGFDPNDVSQFVARVNGLLADPDLANRIGTANQHRVDEEFSVQKMVDSYRDLYERIGS